jgi:signal transduction histidine kinase
MEKVRVRIGKARDLARESLGEARRSVEALRASSLEATPLSEALADLLTQMVRGTAMKSQYVLTGVPRNLPDGIEHCLLRIGQQAIANAVEHAHAQEVNMELSFEIGQVRLRVHDDGQGFDPHFSDAGRFGIIGMRERAEKVGGKFSLVSHPGEGTDVELTIPVAQEAPLHG